MMMMMEKVKPKFKFLPRRLHPFPSVKPPAYLPPPKVLLDAISSELRVKLDFLIGSRIPIRTTLFRTEHDGGNNPSTLLCNSISIILKTRAVFNLSAHPSPERPPRTRRKFRSVSGCQKANETAICWASCVPRRSVWWMNGVKMGHYVIKTRAGSIFFRFREMMAESEEP